ncbi:helix-turn-helix domain-containing protein [Streptomyces sp. NPDC093085]|uniref:ArsR/SmtB family transcription factor n=1 Tax=Streptomyces sp. NPDC093085 TaxID=3155068 RepID=UPI003427FEE9
MPEPEPEPMSESTESTPQPPPEGAQPPPHNVRTLDARSLRGLAHPLRMRLLSTLRHNGPATASQLAARLGESSGATSYHLRQLAEYGFVEDDPERGKGRERWWKAAQDGVRFTEELHANPDPEVRGAADLFLHEVATTHTQELTTWLGTAGDWPVEWSQAADMSDFTLRLTAAQLIEMNEKVHEVIEGYRRLGPAAEDAPKVRIHLHAFPHAGPTG